MQLQMQQESTTYSSNGNKRRKLTTSSPSSSSQPTTGKVNGWWIGLTITMNKESLKYHHNNIKLSSSTVIATIHDYNHDTKESQLWIMSSSNSSSSQYDEIYVDHINFNQSSLCYTINGDISQNETLSIPSHNQWIPMKLSIGCTVTIHHSNFIGSYQEMKGIIDAYDTRSRRHHITYHPINDRKMSEWLWCTNNNTKLLSNNTNTVPVRIKPIQPPPFDPTVYGLDTSFIDISRKRSNDNQHPSNSPPNKKRKILANTEESGLIIRIPKMTEKANNDNDTNTPSVTTESTDNREIITISSSQSASPPKTNQSHRHHSRSHAHFIDLCEDQEEEIIVGTREYREYNRQLKRRQKEQKRRHKKDKKRRRHLKYRGSAKYPRKTKLGGIKWKRKYAKEEKKYYWIQKHNESTSSWNPWKDNGQIAPWLKGRSNWEKWYDADNKRYYYYNPLNGNSTYQRPADYSSPEEIDHDSIDDDEERYLMEKIKPDHPINNDQDVQMIAIAHPKPSHKSRSQRHHHRSKHTHNSRRNKAFDPNAGGFSFFDVPTNADHEKKENGANSNHNKKHSKSHEEDVSLLQAVNGLHDILNGNIKTSGTKTIETSDSKSREETVESQRSESMEDMFDHDNNGRYDTDEIWKECWKILEPKVRENPSIKFQELISTHAKGWPLIEEVVKELKNKYNETVVEIFQSKTNNELTLKLDDNDCNGGNGKGANNGNSSLMDIDVNNGIDTKKKTTKQTVWAQLVTNLQSVYKSQNKKAIKFVLEVYQIHDHEEDIEQRAKCWSILTQNADHLVRILKSDRKGFIEDITKILLLMIDDDNDNDKKNVNVNDDDKEDGDSMKVDIDDFFQTFGFEFIDEYIYSLIQYGKSNKQIIKIISILSKSCIVYQLIGCMRINELLNRWNILTLLNRWNITNDIFNSNNKKKKDEEQEEEEEKEEVNASILLAIEVLKLIEILTKGISSYDNKDKDGKNKISKLQKECIVEIQGNVSDYIPNGFALDVLFQTISSILKYNLETNAKSNIIVFELCCNILTNIISIDEPIILKLLNTPYKRSKRIILFLHKTYTELRINARHRKNKRKKNGHHNHNHNIMDTESDDDSFYNNTDSDDMSPRKLINRVIQPYEFKNYDDASFEPYGIELDVSQREDSKQLSNIDCRESIADILLRYIQIISMDDGGAESDNFTNIPKYKYLICNIFYQALNSKHLVKVSWGYNKALNHYHRDNICIDWIKQELLYQHKLDGREHPDQNNQPQRHFRICSLIEILFDPLIWDYQIYHNLLQTLCNLCIEYKTKTNENMTTWKKLKQQLNNDKNEKNEIELMNLYTSNLWNEIVAKCKSIITKQKQEKQLNKNDLIFLQLLHQCVIQNDHNHHNNKNNKNNDNIDVTQLCSDFETMLRSKNRSLLSKRGDIDDLISQFLRSNTLHLLVGLTQMEATCVHTRNCARRGIRCIVWSVNQKSKKLLKKSQIPFLPTINYCYTTYSEHQKQLETLIENRKNQNILVVGDGNLSFGRALSRIFGNPSTKSKLNKLKRSRNNIDEIEYGARNVIVTCYESAMELLSRYPHSGSVVAEITDRGGFVLYGIDATSLKKTLTNSYITYGGDKRPFPLFESNKDFSQFKYDVIIWNFPHAMNRSYNPKVNGDLVENFFISAKEILRENGEIHITLHINHQIDDEVGKKAAASREYRQYETWGVGHRADLQQLRCIKRTELNHRLYPGYAIKNVQGNPFNIVKAETYIFKRTSESKDL